MSGCSGCINDTDEMKYVGLHKCKLQFDVKTTMDGTYLIDANSKEVDECIEFRTATIKDAMKYLCGEDDSQKQVFENVIKSNINCPALKDPYEFEGCDGCGNLDGICKQFFIDASLIECDD